MGLEPFLGLFHYVLDNTTSSSNWPLPPIHLWSRVVHHVDFPAYINIAEAFEYVYSAARNWGIRDPSVLHEYHISQVSMNTDPSTRVVEAGQHSFRLADGGVMRMLSLAKQLEFPCRASLLEFHMI